MEKAQRNKIPVVFIHEGQQDYLFIALHQAQKYNQEVILLGDESNRKAQCLWYPMAMYSRQDYARFQLVYQHLSTNPEHFELVCFKRFFVLYQFMKEHKMQQCVYLDSDVMTYVNFTDWYSRHCCKTALSFIGDPVVKSYAASPHCSYWTVEYLEDFLAFVLEMYTSRFDILLNIYYEIRKGGTEGGICDMTLFNLWRKKKEKIMSQTGIVNITEVIDGCVFDDNLNSNTNYMLDEYEMFSYIKLKKIIFKRHEPFFMSKKGEIIKANTLHLQGISKKYMRAIVEEDLLKIYFICTCMKVRIMLGKSFVGKLFRQMIHRR